MDVEGIDVAVLYGTLALGLWSIRDLDLHIACCQAFNDWLASYCARDPVRRRAAAALPLPALDAAVAEAERAVTELGAVTPHRPGAVLGRTLDDPRCSPCTSPQIGSTCRSVSTPEARDSASTGSSTSTRWRTPAPSRWTSCWAPPRCSAAESSSDSAGCASACSKPDAGGSRGSWNDWTNTSRSARTRCRRCTSPQASSSPRAASSSRASPRSTGSATPPSGSAPAQWSWASDDPHWDAEFPGSVAAIRDRVDLDPATRRAILGENARRLLGARLDVTPAATKGGT